MKALALDFGGSHVACALVDDMRIEDYSNIPVGPGTLLKDLLPELATTLRSMERRAGLGSDDLAGVAISFCGIVDSAKSVVLSANSKFPDATDLDLHRWAETELELRLSMESDARMALLGEHYAGAVRGIGDAVMLTLGTGIGTAAMSGGRLLRGKHFLAGSLGGHVPLLLGRRPCICGGHGCAETEASGWALPEICRTWPGFESCALAADMLKGALNFETLFRRAAAGDPVAMEIRQRCLEVWAAVALALVHLCDPEFVVLGGGVMQGGDQISVFLGEQLRARAWTPWGKVQVRPAQLGNHAALVGAIPLLSGSTDWKEHDVR